VIACRIWAIFDRVIELSIRGDVRFNANCDQDRAAKQSDAKGHEERFSQGPLSSDGRMNNRMAAPAKNSAPIIALSRALTGKAGNSQPTNAPGQSQQAAPATAKTMARTLIAIAAPSYSHPTIRQARGNKVRSLQTVHKCTESDAQGVVLCGA
jgi:hypothetical protein